MNAKTVYPDGRVETTTLSAGQLAGARRNFSATFDPNTLERLSIKNHREASARKSPPRSAVPSRSSTSNGD
jgi:hypothetical protein